MSRAQVAPGTYRSTYGRRVQVVAVNGENVTHVGFEKVKKHRTVCTQRSDEQGCNRDFAALAMTARDTAERDRWIARISLENLSAINQRYLTSSAITDEEIDDVLRDIAGAA